MARRLLPLLCVATVCMAVAVPAQAHRAKLDEMGCHKDRASSYYHCHEGELAGRQFAQKTGAKRALKKLHKMQADEQKAARAQEQSEQVLAAADEIRAAVARQHAVDSPSAAPLNDGFPHYRAELVRVVDAATLELQVQVWPGVSRLATVRLAGITAPDDAVCARADAAAAKGFLQGWAAAGGTLSVSSVTGDGDRVSARISRNGADLGEALVAADLARTGDGPWCE